MSDLVASVLGAHDPALAEAAQGDGQADELAVIVRLSDGDELPAGIRIVTCFGDIATLRVQRARLAELAQSASVIAIEASRRLRLNDADDESVPADSGLQPGRHDQADGDDEPQPRYLRRPPGLVASGAGVVFGVLDWGLDVAHPAFRRDDGSTRLLALWDQRGDDASGAGNRWGYGRIIHAAQIDQALREPDPYAALGYHPADADERDAESGQWQGAHGTHVVDIAAGNGRGGGMVGVAPRADIVFVHLSRTTSVLGRGNLGDSTTVLEALDFIFSLAGDRPCVVNMSVGAHGGPHDGSTLVEQGIDQAIWTRPGRAVVNSAGNYYAAGAHANGRLYAGGSAALRFTVPAGDATDSEIEIFYESVDRYTATVFEPGGSIAASVGPDQDSPLRVGGAVVGHVYHHVRESTSGDRHIDLFLNADPPAGIWEIRLAGDVVRDGRFHAWIERDRGLRPRFVAADVATDSTTGTLCNGRYSIAVGAYNPRRTDWPLGAFSSAGPTRDGRVKPELTAPGERIRAGRSTPPHETPGARYTDKSGTSMAAPHVSGAIAVMFEAAGRPLEIADTRALLFGSTDCSPPGSAGVPAADLHRRGFGYLNVVAAERAAADWGRGGLQQADPGLRDELMEALPDDIVAEAIDTDNAADAHDYTDADDGPDAAEDEAEGDDADADADTTAASYTTVEDDMSDDPTLLETNFDSQADPVDSDAPSRWRADETEPGIEFQEAISIDDVADEMNGLRCRFVREFTASRGDGSSRGFGADSLHLIEAWHGAAVEASIAGFRVPKVLLAPHLDRIASVRRYDVALDAQRSAVSDNARQLRDWLAQQSSYRSRPAVSERERQRLAQLLDRRQAVYSRMWVRQAMFNRFDGDIARWSAHYSSQLRPATALDPNIVKSMLYQESRMGTSGVHLMPPPSDWSSSDRHPVRSRFNIGQAIDSWGPQQWLMMREMAPLIFARHGLDAFDARRRWFGMSNAEYAAHAPFVRALQEFFEHRDGTRNLMGTPGRDLHEDYGFWIRTAVRWLFVKFALLTPPSWAEAVRAYNGGGAGARRYRDAVMARVGSTQPFAGESLDDGGQALQEDRTPRLDSAAELTWQDLTRTSDSAGQQQLFVLVTGAPAGVALAGGEGRAIFHLRVRNKNSVYNHKNVVTKYRLLDILPNRQFNEVLPWRRFNGPDLEDESSRVIKISIDGRTLREAYDPDSPLARLEVEYHWRETFEDHQEHINRTGLDFAIVAPIEYLFGRKTRLSQRDIELKDPVLHKDDYWIALPGGGVNFSADVRQPVTVQLDVSTLVGSATTAQQGASTSTTSTRTQSTSNSRTFSLQLNGEVSGGGSAKASIDIFELGLERMFKLGGSMGYSRTTTDTSTTAVAREFSRSLSLSRAYSTSQAVATKTTITVSPPEVPEPGGTGGARRNPPARSSGIGSVGVYLYPLVAFFEVPFVRFDGANRMGQATRRSAGSVAVPFVTAWRLTTLRGG